MSRKTRLVDCEVRAAKGQDRTLTFIASTEMVGRDGDIIRANGWNTENYERNAAFLWAHDPKVPPIGRTVALRKVLDGDNPRLEADVQFAGLAEDHELAEQIYQLYRNGFLNTVSVGYIPKERAELTDDERRDLGLDPWGNVLTRQELLEISAVSVPADPGAVVVSSSVDLTDAVAAVRSASKLWSRDWDLLEQMANGTEPQELPTTSTDSRAILAEGVVVSPFFIPLPAGLTDEQRNALAEQASVTVTSSLGDVLREFAPDLIPPTPEANGEGETAEDRSPKDDGWGDLAKAIRKQKEGHR